MFSVREWLALYIGCDPRALEWDEEEASSTPREIRYNRGGRPFACVQVGEPRMLGSQDVIRILTATWSDNGSAVISLPRDQRIVP